MNAIGLRDSPCRMSMILAVFSVVFFWVLPASPLVAVAAMAMTSQETGWSQKFAVAGALLSAVFTTASAVVVIGKAIQAGLI